MDELKKMIKKFSQARDWEQFHAPKNLAMALSTEAAEILEIFQWKEASESLSEQEQENLRQEIGDVLIYLIELADKYQIDILEAARLKCGSMSRNTQLRRSKAGRINIQNTNDWNWKMAGDRFDISLRAGAAISCCQADLWQTLNLPGDISSGFC